MKIVVDAFGGDNAPLCNIQGALSARNELGVDIALCGNQKLLLECAEQNGISLEGIEIVDAPDVFSMHDQPSDIIKSGKNSSLAVGLKYAADGFADAFVSAGSTGAVVVGGTFICKRMKGVKRAALGTVMPAKSGSFMMMDIGANAECRPEMLLQFGVMSSVYLEKIEGRTNPSIALLNIGTEDTKGTELQLEAYKLLKNAPINFYGNIEARDVPAGLCDAVIADGFTGNVALKMYEGVATTLFSIIKNAFRATLRTKIAGALALPAMRGLKARFDYTEIGGAMLIGLRVPVIKAHGSSNAKAIKNAIRQARDAVAGDLVGNLAKALEQTEINSTNGEE